MLKERFHFKISCYLSVLTSVVVEENLSLDLPTEGMGPPGSSGGKEILHLDQAFEGKDPRCSYQGRENLYLHQ